MPKKLSQTEKKTYPECGTWGKTNHPEERCWQGAGAHLKAKRNRPDDSSDNNPDSKARTSQYNFTSSRSQSLSKKDDPKNELYHVFNITI